MESAGERAADGAAPWRGRCAGAVAATVEAIGDPDRAAELLRCVESPDASPRLVSATPARARDRDRDEGERGTGAGDEERAGEVAQKLPWTGTWVAHRIPAPIRVMPSAITSLADARVTSACGGPARATEVRDVGQPGEAGLHRGVAEHLLHVERADEDEPKKLPPSSRPTAFAPGERLQPEDPQRQQRRLDAGLDHHEGGEQRGGRREQGERPGGCPAVCGACEIA